MNNNYSPSNYTDLKEQVRSGVDTWDNIFWGDDATNASQTYSNLALDNRQERALLISQKHRLQALLATSPINTKWLIDLALQNCEKNIKTLNNKEFKYQFTIDRINGVKPKTKVNYYNLELIKAVPIENFIASGQRLNNDKSLHICPLHNEKTASFHYYKKQNSFSCYGCGKAGDNIQFIMELHKLSFKEACAFLSKYI